MKKSELRQLIKEQILLEFKVDPNLTFKIYDILNKKVKNFKDEFPIKTQFFHFLNDSL